MLARGQITVTNLDDGIGIKSVKEYYATSTSNVTPPSSWSETPKTTDTTNKYLWNYEVYTYSNGDVKETNKRVIGTHGTTGATGNGITSVTNRYLATTLATGVTTATSGWTTTVQKTDSVKKYLWNYEEILYTNGTKIPTTPVIIGTHGEKGDKGSTGVGIKDIQEFYLASPLGEGVTRSTDGWTSDVQAIDSDKKYLWNYEKINYDNNTNYLTAPVIIGTFGSQGIGVKGVTEYYLASPLSEGIRKDTNGWTTEMQPLTPENKYLWNKEIIHYTDDESALKDKTEVLSGTEIFTDKADADAVVHVEIDGKSWQNFDPNARNMIPTNYNDWEPGHYKLTDGSKEDYRNRIRIPFLVEVEPNTSYYLNSGDSTISFVVRGYDSSKNLGQSIGGVNSPGVINTESTTRYLGIALYTFGDTAVDYQSKFELGEIKPLLQLASISDRNLIDYVPQKPTPDYPVEIHSLNDFDVVSSVGRRNLLPSFTGNKWSNLSSSGIETLSPYQLLFKAGSSSTTYTDIVLEPKTDYTMTFNSDHQRYYIYQIVDGQASTIVRTITEGSDVFTFNTGEITEYRILLNNWSQRVDVDRRVWNIKLEKNTATNWSPAPEDISEDSSGTTINKINLSLSEPLRSVGDVKDRLFRDSDGLWKVERNVGDMLLKDLSISTTTPFGGSNSYHFGGSVAFIVDSGNKLGRHTYSGFKSSFLRDAGSRNNYNDTTNSHTELVGTVARIAGEAHRVFVRVSESTIGVAEGDSTSTLVSKFRGWVTENNVSLQYQLVNPTIETLPQSYQDKLNNIATYAGSNYLYTVVDKTNILPNYVSENLKPNLHATFKSKAWSGNNAGYPSVIGVYGDSAKMLYLSTTAESMTFNADGTPNPSSQVITLTANLQNVSGNASFAATAYNGSTVVSNVVLSGVGNTRTFNQAQFPASANRVQVRATLGNLVDTVTIVKLSNGSNGQNAVVGLLTNESITLPANKDGLVSSFVGATGIFDVYDGIAKKTGSGVAYSLVSQSNITVAINATTGVYSVTAMPTGTTVLNGHAVLRAVYNGVTIEKQLNVSKSVTGATGATGSTGAPGASATSYWITASNNIIGKSQTGVINPTTITFKGFSKTGTANSVAYSGRFIVQTSTNGTTYTTRYTSSADQNTYTYTIPSDSLFVKCLFYMAGGTSVLLDEQTVPVVESAEGIEIGVENLLRNSNFKNGLTHWTAHAGSSLSINSIGNMVISYTGSTNDNSGMAQSANLPVSDYVITAKIKRSTEDITTKFQIGQVNNYEPTLPPINTWGVITAYLKNTGGMFYIWRNNPGATGTLEIEWIKVEKGNKATDWRPHPEDARTYKAWANSADGGEDFTRVYPNENILIDTKFDGESWTGYQSPTISYPVVDGTKNIKMVKTNTSQQGIRTTNTIDLEKGVPYTLSYQARGTLTHSTNFVMLSPGPNHSFFSQTGALTTTFKQFTQTFTVPTSLTGVSVDILFTHSSSAGTSGQWLEIKGGTVKLEKGTTPTIYTTNPSDSLTGSVPKYVGFSPLDSDKPSDYEWIINPEWTESSSMEYTSSKIEQTSESIMTTVTESFVGSDEFGTYIESVGTQFQQTADDFNFIFDGVKESINGVAENVEKNYSEIQKYIRFEDGNIILGSSDSDSTLKITQNEIAFMQGGSKVAYFSGQSFYINKGILVESMQVGEHRMTRGSGGHTSFDWIG